MDRRPDDFQPSRSTANEPDASRLSPAMASQRLLVLDFVRGYFARWKYSPSQGEIAGALNIDSGKVRRSIRSLVRDGLLIRTPGARGLMLPDTEAEAIRQLRAMGWTVNGQRADVSKTTLLPPAALDYPGPDGQEDGANDDEAFDGSGSTRAQGA